MTGRLSRRALLGWLLLGPALAGCATRHELYRASHNPAETPADWFYGRGCDGAGTIGGYRRGGHHGRHGGGRHYAGDPCLDYRSAVDGYPDTRGGSLPPRGPRGPAGRRH